jgi:hypothetical protein
VKCSRNVGAASPAARFVGAFFTAQLPTRERGCGAPVADAAKDVVAGDAARRQSARAIIVHAAAHKKNFK